MVFPRLTDSPPHFDMALLARVDLALLNCLSTFSGAVARERSLMSRPTLFFGLPNQRHLGPDLLSRFIRLSEATRHSRINNESGLSGHIEL
ncbi:unnamed protein product [Protopolystoma xenopodis]|uniref:Uncharacterized protein n=1 Tax=Protopolystoma xenopodis TaxID=117903 RepID=A0A3S5BFB9_9PLAT|nr:unnamed protein product [Protopolystoma xenopodis]